MNYRIQDISQELPRNPAGYPRRRALGVVAFMPHHFGAWGGTAEWAAEIHLGKWETAGGIAYGWFIPEEDNDVIYYCHSIEEKGYHCGGGGMNSKAMSCCVAGNFEERPPKPWQIDKLVWLIIHTNDRDNLQRLIVWHNDHRPTACPGRYFPKEEVIRRVTEHYRQREEEQEEQEPEEPPQPPRDTLPGEPPTTPEPTPPAPPTGCVGAILLIVALATAITLT